jgi:disulfide bond formation protein DsbB
MTAFVQNITNLLSSATVVLDVLAVIFFVILITPLRRYGKTGRLAEFFGERAIIFGFLIAFLAAAGSLFYSNVAGFAPCELCWWIRVLLYPQAILLFIALFKNNSAARNSIVRLNSIVLSAIGGLIALYQTFLQLGVIGNDLIPCDATGVSCQHVYFLSYGYVTIPTMALTTFVLILLFMCAPNRAGRQVNEL